MLHLLIFTHTCQSSPAYKNNNTHDPWQSDLLRISYKYPIALIADMEQMDPPYQDLHQDPAQANEVSLKSASPILPQVLFGQYLLSG